MKDPTTRRSLLGAIYTKVSTDQRLEQDFNALDAHRWWRTGRPSGARHGSRRGVRLEWLCLPQTFAGRYGDERREPEWTPLLWKGGATPTPKPSLDTGVSDPRQARALHEVRR
jgi:hypothetical protein